MQTFPRLTAVFGVPVAELTAASIDRAIANQVPEAGDLDWKQMLYPDTSEGRGELAKDVAALANASGGILVLGVQEDGSSRASASTPVAVSNSETERMQKICQHLVRPFLPGVKVRPLHLAPTSGYYVIVVPRSPDAPHAVVNGNKGHLLSYPLRDEATTRWLGEGEIAARYRDRYASRAENGAALDRAHAEGVARLTTGRPWIAVSLHPSVPAYRASGAHVLAAIDGFVSSWVQYFAPPTGPFIGSKKVAPGVRRAMVTGADDYRGSASEYPHAELHYNGAGFAASPVLTIDDSGALSAVVEQNGQSARIPQDLMEFYLFGLISLLAHHAVNSGAANDCELQAQLVLPKFPANERISRSSEMYGPVSWSEGSVMDEYERVREALPLATQGTPTRITMNLDELVSSPRMVVSAAYTLATDILGEFAIANPCVLRSDGYLDLSRTMKGRRAEFAQWAKKHHLLDLP
ncbi:ATP-binding protein [Nocardia sp. NPDC050413]|uniref:AlbA family DNA-binding domain-containing protein n=1 Tax=Nocardia sp. NPDC050413 TaxID=3155784 RepID=UPI0033EE8E30